jgi:hypothetical protein
MRSMFVLRLGAVVGVVAAILLTGVPAQVIAASSLESIADDGTVVTAAYEGVPIDPHTASRYFCHTRDYPAVRCFASQAEVDEDLGWVEPTAPGGTAASAASSSSDVSPDWPQGVAYSIAYWDINYGGSALTLFGALPNLGIIGWNDSISSIKSVNCGIPWYYIDANYGGIYWQNACNVWLPNLYSSNDTFSSVVNEAP